MSVLQHGCSTRPGSERVPLPGRMVDLRGPAAIHSIARPVSGRERRGPELVRPGASAPWVVWGPRRMAAPDLVVGAVRFRPCHEARPEDGRTGGRTDRRSHRAVAARNDCLTRHGALDVHRAGDAIAFPS